MRKLGVISIQDRRKLFRLDCTTYAGRLQDLLKVYKEINASVTMNGGYFYVDWKHPNKNASLIGDFIFEGESIGSYTAKQGGYFATSNEKKQLISYWKNC